MCGARVMRARVRECTARRAGPQSQATDAAGGGGGGDSDGDGKPGTAGPGGGPLLAGLREAPGRAGPALSAKRRRVGEDGVNPGPAALFEDSDEYRARAGQGPDSEQGQRTRDGQDRGTPAAGAAGATPLLGGGRTPAYAGKTPGPPLTDNTPFHPSRGVPPRQQDYHDVTALMDSE
jgi:hypothetical protein